MQELVTKSWGNKKKSNDIEEQKTVVFSLLQLARAAQDT